MIYKSSYLRLQLSFGGGQSSGVQSSAPQMSPQQMLALYQSSIPGTLSATANALSPVSNALAVDTAAANPIYTQSGLNQLNQYAPGYQQAGANLANQQAATTNALLNGNAGQAATSAVELNNRLNPVQAQSNQQAQNLLSSINLNGLSPGEQNATQRSLNQSNYATGNLGLDNATTAVSNALNFGGAFNNKLGILGSALGAAGGVANNQNSQVNPVNTAFNSANTAGNFGLGTFAPTQANGTATAPLSSATSFGGSLAGVSTAPISSGHQSAWNFNQSSGCYLTTVCCEYKGLPDDCEELQTLRMFRDSHVPKTMVDEYYKVAPAIVRKIKNNNKELEYVYGVVQECVRLIKSGEYSTALISYKNMVIKLQAL